MFVERDGIRRSISVRLHCRISDGERQGSRILQDMHDGIGAQLITALRLARQPDVEREQLAQHIEESLQDLRQIIDSLDFAENDLLPLLGNVRFRLQPRLEKLGTTLV